MALFPASAPGLLLEGRMRIDEEWAGRVTGVRGQRVEIAMMRTPDGHSRLELSRFDAPAIASDRRTAPVNSQRQENAEASLQRPLARQQAREADWPEFISAVRQSRLTPELGLLLHGYHGPLDEEFVVQRQEHVPADAPIVEVLSLMEEDVLYVFRAKA